MDTNLERIKKVSSKSHLTLELNCVFLQVKIETRKKTTNTKWNQLVLNTSSQRYPVVL